MKYQHQPIDTVERLESNNESGEGNEEISISPLARSQFLPSPKRGKEWPSEERNRLSGLAAKRTKSRRQRKRSSMAIEEIGSE